MFILLDVPNFLHYLAYKRINYLPTGMDVAVPLQTQNPYRIETPIESYLPIFFRVRCKHGNPREPEVWISSDTGILPPKMVL